VAAVALAAAAAVPAPLSVPYLPQTEALCGGASAAMVMRYWGARDVYADDFAPLVDRSAGGIHTSALVGALEARQWTAVAGPGDMSALAREVGRGRPVIALIEDRPGRYHYVVVLAAGDREVILHDPARAPSRRVDAARFDAAWQKSERWMLILLPNPAAPADGAGGSPSSTAESRSDAVVQRSGCAAVDEAVAAAAADKGTARQRLTAAVAACPGSAAPWRELAGLDALENNWTDAAAHARRAVDLDPADAHAWRVLATARFVTHDDLGALAAWNRIGEPRADLIDIKGLAHTRYRVVSDAIGLRPKQLVTADALRLAQQRVRDVPAVAAARVSYHPTEEGRAQIDAAVLERDRAPLTWPAWLGIGAGALANREATAVFTNVSGGGDAVTAAWRWWEHRPMIGASYAAPGPGGIWTIDASRETQTFGTAAVEETRTRAGLQIRNWIGQRARVSGGVGLERWSDRGRSASFAAAAEFWPLVDRLAIEGRTTAWRGGGDPFSTAAAIARFRSKTASTATVWLLDAGYRIASESSPASVWPGGDTGHARDVLLRAHPLLDGGIITGGVFGRRVASGSAELQHWIAPRTRPFRFAPAAFVDVARATRGLPTTDTRVQVDAGGGIRLSLFGMGVLRIDAAHGLRDGRSALSIGWQR